MFLIKKNIAATNSIENIIVLCFEYSIAPVKLKIINVKASAIKTPDISINNLFLLFNKSNALTPSISGFHFQIPQINL
jgi:hypothetical protein